MDEACVLAWKPVPMESKRSGSCFARVGHRIFRSWSAINTGLLNFMPPSLKVSFVGP